MVRKFRHIAFLGDSLSDRGTMDRRKLLGFIPMDFLSGLKGKSPLGRFTNGFLWGDFVAATTIEQLEIERFKRLEKLPKTDVGNADLGDLILINDHNLKKRNENAFSLNDDLHVLYEGHRFARFYCEGGLTAHDYSLGGTWDIGKEGAREIVATLDAKRNLLLEDDKKNHIGPSEKEDTLIIEWSGANDLITVNERPTKGEADKAVAARIKNIEQMIANGYRNFILFNLPDLSLTPRYARKGGQEQKNAHEISMYFNAQLAEECKRLKEKYAKLDTPLFLDVFDVCARLQDAYENPEKYGFSKDKLTQPFTESEEFKSDQKNPIDQKEHISPADQYMFWDDVHPTADMHAHLADEFKQYYQGKIRFEPPASQHDEKKSKQLFLDELGVDEPSAKPLPQKVSALLISLRTQATSLSKSSSTTRRDKGIYLQELHDNIVKAKGNLEAIFNTLSTLETNTVKMDVIKTHKNPLYDFFTRKQTTYSQDLINSLQSAVEEAINAHDSKDEEKEHRQSLKHSQ